MTVRFVPEKRMRAPFEVGCSPSPASSTPAFLSSSLYRPIAARISGSGRAPDSDIAFPLTIAMNRIVVSPCGSGYGTRRPPRLDRGDPGSTGTTSDRGRDRQAPTIFFQPPGRFQPRRARGPRDELLACGGAERRRGAGGEDWA